jgi:hypothetical protein
VTVGSELAVEVVGVLDGVLAVVVVSLPAALVESVLGADDETGVGAGATVSEAGGEVVLEADTVEDESGAVAVDVVAGAVESVEVVASAVESVEVAAGAVESVWVAAGAVESVGVVAGAVASEVVAGAVEVVAGAGDADGVLSGAGVESEVEVDSALGAVVAVLGETFLGETFLGDAFLTESLAP